jgi:diguanylate cyclase (GGDEF)-like protein/PAS domain S-box-containing protein
LNDSRSVPGDKAPHDTAVERARAALAGLSDLLRTGKLDEPTKAAVRRAIASTEALIREALAERERADGLFNALPDPVSVIGADGTVLDLNAAGLRAYGRPRDEIVGHLVHVINPDLPRDHMIPVWEALNRGASYVVEVTNMRSDGTRFPVEVHSATFNDRGERHIVAVARDLSRRNEAELAYRQLLEAIDKGIVVHDAAGRIVSGNPAAMRMFGIAEGESLAEALDFDHWLILDERGRQIHFDDMPPMRALRSGQTIDSTLLGLHHHGRMPLSWLSVTSVPQYQPDADRPSHVISLFSDVTALKRDSALFDRAQSLARIGGWEWDAGRNRLYMTDEALRIVGREDDPPADFADVVRQLCAADRPRLEGALAQLFRDGGNFDLEVYGQRPDGETLWTRIIGEAEGSGPAITRITGTIQDITARKDEEERLRVMARTDPLTGLLNRDGAMAELHARLSTPGAHTALHYIDLDRFKMVNDVLGHGAGDQVLVGVARRLQRAAGDYAALARIGGDEFLAIQPLVGEVGDAQPLPPEDLAARITEAFVESFRIADEDFAITASVGLALAPEHGEHPETLLNNADAAMYDAKRRGRSTWQRFTPRLARRQHDNAQVETQLRRALENEEFHLVYQPVVSLHDGGVVGAEALIRWRHRTLGELTPDHFIAQAETTGDIVRIGAWVIREACRQLGQWRAGGFPVQRVAVNVSYRQFLGDELPQVVAAALAAAKLPGDALELEVTERVLIEDAPDTWSAFDALRAQGVGLVIDDFGEGYSALNYLRRLPIQGLKLSRSFLEGVPNNTSDVAICEAVAAIARSLGLSVVAEGVETEEQRRFLLRLGVDHGQGFLYAPGLPPDVFGEYARQHGNGG